MSLLLDIDLDCFNLMDNPAKRLAELLACADRLVSLIVEDHHKVLRWWRSWVKRGKLRQPKYILHVDEDHDMMDEKKTPNITNFICHAMRIWPEVRVHGLVEYAIDSPAMWLSDDTWAMLSRRFTCGSHRLCKWPKPQPVSVCTSPEFVSGRLRYELMTIIEKSMGRKQG